jgi:GTP-binding protein HflX
VTAGRGVDLKREGPRATRAIVLHVEFKGKDAASDRDAQSRLDEAVGLAAAIDLDVLDRQIAMLAARRPATLIGKGKVDEIAAKIAATGAELIVVNAQVSPIQQRNLEQAWKAKVLDRTGLILEIFGRRARTREGTLQVELAHLQYQKSRLVRSWTHLERQRGGFGFLGGPGERQLEADRRLIEERITRIRAQLDSVVKTRALHRRSRARVPYPVVALVGYTNAGKSTLFNALTKSQVLAKDLLFATLDPTMRQIALPHGCKIILSDTVGFISDLPTSLIAAFRATLEEVIAADIILHVRDVSHAESESQAADVAKVLDELGIDQVRRAQIIEVWNKADILTKEENARLAAMAMRKSGCVLVSSITGAGLDRLSDLIESRIAAHDETYDIYLDPADGESLNWLYERAEVLDRRNFRDGRLCVTVRLGEKRRGQAERRFGRAMRRMQERAAAAE